MADDIVDTSPARFSGEYEHSVDEKGRVTLPAKVRDALGAVAFLTRGLDGCLFLYSEPRWHEITDQVGRLSLSKRSTRVFTRMIFAGTRCDLDRAGRILIPLGLRKFAGIADQAIIVGVEDRVELWAPDRWEDAMSILCNANDTVSDEWEALGI